MILKFISNLFVLFLLPKQYLKYIFPKKIKHTNTIYILEKSFTFNEKNEVIVYTDGACSNNGYKGASAGAGVWFGNHHPL